MRPYSDNQERLAAFFSQHQRKLFERLIAVTRGTPQFGEHELLQVQQQYYEDRTLRLDYMTLCFTKELRADRVWLHLMLQVPREGCNWHQLAVLRSIFFYEEEDVFVMLPNAEEYLSPKQEVRLDIWSPWKRNIETMGPAVR